ncbi:MAG: PqqD family protein [Myxococcales bacterium]|nr:PqqD family protein [Myxococcales bacterium]
MPRFTCSDPALAAELRARGWRSTTSAAVDLHARLVPPSYPEWRATKGWVLHAPGIGAVLDARRRRAVLARLPPLRLARPFRAPLLVAPGDPARAWTTAHGLRHARATLATVAAAVRLSSIAEAAIAGLSLARCAALLQVSHDGAALSLVRVTDDPALYLEALETLGVLRARSTRAFEPLALDARRLVAPRRVELAQLRAAGAAPCDRFSPRKARARVVEGACRVVANGHAYLLDDVGGYVFLRVVDDGASVGEVVHELRRRFVVSRTAVEGDVYEALATWVARGWVSGKIEAP